MRAALTRPAPTVLSRGIQVFLVTALLAACAAAPERNPVPLDLLADAEVPGFPDVRSWGDEFSPHFQADMVQSIRDEPPGLFPPNADGTLEYASLGLTGGGANGAFGAGFLNGWTSTGERPVFKLVTGISTGALIAPHAFLGADYDEALKANYTEISQEDIFTPRKKLTILKQTSITDSAPLRALIERSITPQVLEEIAAAHKQGRRLYVGTTHLDAMRIMVWNMGAIAASGHPEALTLFHDVLLASASIPVAFPPVFFDVDVDGESYDEMHVDGGTVGQVFVYGAMINIPAAYAEATGAPTPEDRSTLYIIRNGKIGPESEHIDAKLLPIAERSISTQGRAAMWGDLYRIYALTRRDGYSFSLVSVPDDDEPISNEPFNNAEMRRLFQVGFDVAVEGNHWIDGPPGFRTD